MKKIAILVSFIIISSCKVAQKTEVKKEAIVETNPETNEWVYLFDGSTTKGWRAYNGDSLPPGWTIKDSTLTFDTALGLEQDYEGGTDIIYGAEEFDNFELYLEWKIPEGGNSGIFYHVKEGYDGPPVVSPEYQLIDDENYARIHNLTDYNSQFGAKNPEVLQDWQKTGADYAMHVADESQKELNPVGEWNSSRIVFTPEKVEHWLNGKKLLEFQPWSEDWNKKKNSGKWDNAPDYGKFKKGFIALQDHSSPIWFKNIKIRRL
ncbi:3-keto-disaccharide hydrolase [Flagellimonas sp. W118]|uniref:3-keto-disaccharide hydrolase n=1 Tax=Flagellimonas sp. W118 TaxID=3410791 RepID=UPI003BF47CAE